MSEQTPYTILTEARMLVAKGWTQGALETYDGRVCAIGALNKAAKVAQAESTVNTTETPIGKAGHYLADAIMDAGIQNEHVASIITDFNDFDASKRTMLKTFDKAIKQARRCEDGQA